MACMAGACWHAETMKSSQASGTAAAVGCPPMDDGLVCGPWPVAQPPKTCMRPNRQAAINLNSGFE